MSMISVSGVAVRVRFSIQGLALWLPGLGVEFVRGSGSIMAPVEAYFSLVGNGRMVVIVVIIVPHSSIPY